MEVLCQCYAIRSSEFANLNSTAREVISDMYANFFGLRRLPFEDRVDTKFFFGTPAFEEKLKALEHECHGDPQIALVLGEAGVGKTMLIRTLALRLPVTDHTIVLTCRSDGEMNVLRDVCKTFGAGLPTTETAPRCLARLRRHLKKAGQANHRSILFIDQAENLSRESLSHLTTLADLEDCEGKFLTIILVGQAGLRPLLDHPKLAPLRRRLVSELTLSAMTQAETAQYIARRLRVAGAGEGNLFDQDAVAVIYRAAKGIPAATNRFCDAAMAAACDAGEKRVTRASAVEATRTAATQERSADIRDVGIGGPSPTPSAFPGVAFPHSATDVSAVGPGGIARDQAALLAEQWRASATPAHPDDGYGGDDFETDADDFAPPIGDPADGGTVDTFSQCSAPGPAMALYTAGDTLIGRLESTIAKAERVSATSEATLTQQTAVEKHLGSLMPRAERLLEGLNQAVQDAAG
ncbi:MAG: ExeA family protein, partial [Planctomycetota bacterium]